MSNPPKAWMDVSTNELKGIRGICLDIDDTLSTGGKLTSPAYESLWRLKAAGFAVVPITGRPAGWCDHFARFWPVDAVVGENGAFTFFMHKNCRKRINTLDETSEPNQVQDKLLELRDKIKLRFPQARWASDQAYREYDLAVDICEDVEPWSSEEVTALLTFCEQQGAHAKLSSIHVNIWYGDYDKRRGFQNWLDHGSPGCKEPLPSIHQWIYAGDSPNDEPMFKAFPFSVGVANLKRYLPGLRHPPTWITPSESGNGFVQIADKLIAGVGGGLS